jgi:HK97 family phage portal protein
MTIGTVFRSIRLISEIAAMCELKAYQRLANGDAKLLPAKHWLPELLRKPNPEMAGDTWSEAMYAQCAGWGNAYSQIVRLASGRPAELWPYKVDRMTVYRKDNLEVEYRYPDQFGSPRVLERERVMHLRAFTVDGVMGISPLGVARNTMGLAESAQRYASGFYQSGGRPAGILTADRVLTPQQRTQLKEEYGSIADAASGKKLWLLEAALKYTPITVSPEDMQMLQTRAFQVAEIARFFGVPLFLLMETEKSTSWGSGLEQTNLAFLVYTLRAYLKDMESSWNNFIIPRSEQGEIFVAADTDVLQTADLAALSSFLSTMTQNGLMTRNEGRRRLKLPRDESATADQLTAQVNLVPLDKLGTTEAPQRQALQNAWQLGEDLLRKLPRSTSEEA